MDQKILSLAAEKTADGLQAFLQTLKEEDVSTGKPVPPQANVSPDEDRFPGCVRAVARLAIYSPLSLGDEDLYGYSSWKLRNEEEKRTAGGHLCAFIHTTL